MNKKFLDASKELLHFIEKSPTSFHAVAECAERLEQSGFKRLEEDEDWQIAPGGKYYVTRNESSLMAFVLPIGKAKGVHAVAAHGDSPCFKLKSSPEMTVENHYLRLNVEKYGGMILSTWLDRPLSVAGRVVVKNQKKGRLETRLVRFDQDLCIIPNVAVHLNREMNKGVEYNPQVDMLPLIAEARRAGQLGKKIAEKAQTEQSEILGTELYLYARDKGTFIGLEQEYIASPRLDDLQCAFAGLQAVLKAKPQDYIDLLAVFDNEEVGSGTRQGARSTFLRDTVERICEAFSLTGSEYKKLVAGSFFISADNAHALHPNHPEKSDPTNRPVMNGGIVIKFHGGQQYTTDAWSEGYFTDLCREAGVPVQRYHNRSDIPGGSTLGNLSTAQIPARTIDIGLPQLAMHSAYETAGTKDTWYMIEALKSFYRE